MTLLARLEESWFTLWLRSLTSVFKSGLKEASHSVS
jgi:hypothetical protein